MENLKQMWNDWEIQVMVLFSFLLQVFLLLTGSLRRRKINGLLRLLVWLAYVGADAVAVFALGLFSQYEDKLGRSSSQDTTPFLWIPFLLVHLGGQDSFTALSMEDNNLWLRHLLNLLVQGFLTVYILGKSIHIMDSWVLASAAFVFVSGIIKYGERVWALRSGSRDVLGRSSVDNPVTSNIYSNARRTALRARGLFIGRTVRQLGDEVPGEFKTGFQAHEEDETELGIEVPKEFRRGFQAKKLEAKLEVIMLELEMMFDLLYTKAMVLQSLAGRIFRCVAHVSMVVGLLLFIRSEKHGHGSANIYNKANVAISYTLFVGAIFIEACSVATVIASPWTRARLGEGSFLLRLLSSCSRACSRFMPNNYSIGQFNEANFVFHGPRFRVIYKLISTAFGLGDQWFNQQYETNAEGEEIVRHIIRWFDEDKLIGGWRPKNRRMNYTLCLPFEHALHRLHIFTDFYMRWYFDNPENNRSYGADVVQVKQECEKLSNYMYYLHSVNPTMLPIGTPVKSESISPEERSKGKLAYLETLTDRWVKDPDSVRPFEPARISDSELERSLQDIREMWTRLLIYAAGKCGGEVHARQLGSGGELLTFVWLLMLHHGLGDAATEVNLLTATDDPTLPKPGSLVPYAGNNWGDRPEEPQYAFRFIPQEPPPEFIRRIAERHGMTETAVWDILRPRFQPSEAPSEARPKETEAGTSGEEDKEEDPEMPPRELQHLQPSVAGSEETEAGTSGEEDKEEEQEMPPPELQHLQPSVAGPEETEAGTSGEEDKGEEREMPPPDLQICIHAASPAETEQPGRHL